MSELIWVHPQDVSSSSSPEINLCLGWIPEKQLILEGGYGQSAFSGYSPNPVSGGLMLPSAGCFESRASKPRESHKQGVQESLRLLLYNLGRSCCFASAAFIAVPAWILCSFFRSYVDICSFWLLILSMSRLCRNTLFLKLVPVPFQISNVSSSEKDTHATSTFFPANIFMSRLTYSLETGCNCCWVQWSFLSIYSPPAGEGCGLLSETGSFWGHNKSFICDVCSDPQRISKVKGCSPGDL